MPGLPQSGHRGVEERRPVPSALSFIGDEQSPDVAGLVVRAREALLTCVVL